MSLLIFIFLGLNFLVIGLLIVGVAWATILTLVDRRTLRDARRYIPKAARRADEGTAPGLFDRELDGRPFGK